MQEHPQNLFRGEISTTSNCQVPSIYTQNLVMFIDASYWPIFQCGKKMKRHLMFKLPQHINNWKADKLGIPMTILLSVDV
jgi:hypothetical protein